MPIRVVLIEDNDVFREALELLLELRGEIEIVASEEHGERAVELCQVHEPDVLLLDYRLPGLDGVQIARRVRDECPEVAVVVLTAAAQEREIEALLEQGAVACVGKDEPLDVIVEAVRRAASVGTG
ncbi:MAG TPA: response regulator transcription factor [Gaiellaceae bacterium]|nr:response regulator transcription factor [Gaiellaceae bacterium]